MRIIWSCILSFITLALFAQSKQDYNWILGYDRDQTIPGIEGNILSFHNGQRTITPQNIGCQMGTINASANDYDGNLLFYTNGCVIIDSSHNNMENGENINAGDLHDQVCGHSGYRGTWDSVALPDPSNSDGYYLLQQKMIYITEDEFYIVSPGLQYSYIDMTGNSGLGTVSIKNEEYFSRDSTKGDYGIINGYTAPILHENGKDWWVIYMEEFTNTYFKVLINENGIAVVDSQDIGPNFDDFTSAGGDAVFTPDGSKYLIYNAFQDLLVYDFDRSTSELSNLRRVFVDDDGFFTGIAISSNSRFAYLSSSLDLWQVDLEAENLQASLTHIAEYDGFLDPLPTNFHLAQLAPDCKIYICSTNGTKYLHVINKPNLPGTQCDFQQHSVELVWENFAGSLPNNPHFRIDEEDICDPTITSVFNFPVLINNEIKVYPNPASDEIQLDNISDFKSVELMSISGLSIFKYDFNNLESFSFQLPEYVLPGIYFLRFQLEDRQSVMKKLVVIK